MIPEQQIMQKLATLPAVLANAAVNWTLDNFARQQWNGRPWPPLSKSAIKKKKAGGSILVGKGTGHLRRSIQVVTSASGTGLSFAFGSLGIPYARIHNQGGAITHPARTRQMTFKTYKSGKHKGKTLFHKNNEKASFSRKAQSSVYTINIPQRKFLGETPELKKHLVKIATEYLH